MSRKGENIITKQKFLIIISLLAMYLIWGSTYLAIRVAVAELPPFLMSGTRFIIAGGLLFLFLLLRGTKIPPLRQWVHAGLIGVLMMGGGVSVVAFAEQFVSSSLAAIMITAVPIWAALFSGLFGRWPTRLEWLGVLVGLFGVVLLNLDGEMRAQPLGAIAILFAAANWALGSVLSQHKRVQMPAGGMGFAAEMLAGGVVITLFALLILGERWPANVSWNALGAWLYLAIFGSLIAFSAYMYLVNHVRIALATSYAYVNPLIAVILGIVLAGESISLLVIGAMVVILAGVGLIAYSQSKLSKSVAMATAVQGVDSL